MTGSRLAGRRATAWLIRLGLLGAVALLVLAATIAVGTPSRPAAAARSGYDWVTSWGASPQDPSPGTLGFKGFHDQTVRDIIVPSIGGNMIRLELTNAFGRSPLQVGRVTVAVADLGAGVVPGTIHPVSFGGSASVRIPAGEQVRSDPVGMQVSAMQELAVSIYLPGPTGVATRHTDAQQVNWVSTVGDHAGEAGVGALTIPARSWYYLSGLDVRSSRAAGTVVAFGDSITDGVNSSVGGHDRWSDDLARRLGAVAGPTLSVADEGIGGNRLLTASRCCGASAQARVARDALREPGARLPGAHARHVRIFGATLLPYQGAGYYSPAGEAIREAVNTWIRTSGAFDGVIDFDAAMRDPADPQRLNPAYDSGDRLHPNDAGYPALADAINLDMLLPRQGHAA